MDLVRSGQDDVKMIESYYYYYCYYFYYYYYDILILLKLEINKGSKIPTHLLVYTSGRWLREIDMS